MKESTGDIEEKQQFLVEEIIKKNYNTDNFSEYISNLKENGTDLNNWTFDELKQVVQNFVNQENSNKSNNNDNIEKEVENVRNSFIICEKEENKLNNNNRVLSSNNVNNNPYEKIFNDSEKDLKDIRNSFSNLTKNNIKIPGFEDYEIIETSEFIDSTEDKIQCIKQKENSLTKHNGLYVEILK